MKDLDDPYQLGREYALRRLDRRECSSQDIHNHLIKKGIPKDIVVRVVSDLVTASLVSDERFTKMLVREQAGRAKGPAAIRQKLWQKGIQLDLSEIKTLVSEVTDTTEFESARSLVERKYPNAWNDKNEARRAFQTLLRRGFSYSVVQKVLGAQD